MALTIIVVVVVVLLVAYHSSKKFHYVGEYHLRPCQGRYWKSEFPEASSDEIRRFLKCLIEGMDFGEKDKLKFRPSDEVITIYRSMYGGKTPFSDEMECERFVLGLSKEFKIEPDMLTKPWSDPHVTLGEIFRVIQAEPGATAQRL